MGARASRTDRVLLWVLGLLLLALGAAGLLAAAGVFGEDASSARLVPNVVQDFFAEQGAWVWPAIGVGTLLLALFGLRLLVLQVVTDRVGTLDLTRDRTTGEVILDSSAITDVLTEQVEDLPGVAAAAARVVRQRRETVLVLKVVATSRADLGDLRRRLADDVLTDLGSAFGDDMRWTVRVEIEPSTEGPRKRELV
jgi:hypothetical protein